MRDSFEVVSELIESNPTIDSIAVVAYVEGHNWLDIGTSARCADWDSAAAGLRQDCRERKTYQIARCEASAEKLRGFARDLEAGRLLGIISKVGLFGGTMAHIPMMDFKCPPSEANSHLLGRFLRELGLGRGFLLESGRSYHYFGTRLLDEARWREFLGRCLLMTGYSDDRYIGHQLVDGHCVLRLSAGNLRSKIPTLVAEIQ